jgi:hypothetical protein
METEITALFLSEVDKRMGQASADGRVAAAVRADLENALRQARVTRPRSLPRVTDGLVAKVIRHGLEEEKQSGGDFGLLLVQPRFHFRWGDVHLKRGGHKRGTLVQAKRRLHEARWNQLTGNHNRLCPSE